MGRSIRKMKRTQSASELSKGLKEAYQRGFAAGFEKGAYEQNITDSRHIIKLIEHIEQVKRVGPVTAERLKSYFQEEFKKVILRSEDNGQK